MEIMKLTAILFMAIPFMFLLPGCSTAVKEYQEEKPELLLEDFFDGRLVAYGIVQNFSGKVTRRFKADIVASWNGNQGVLDEQFVFSDGEHQSRCWRLQKDQGRYRGTAGDIVGEALGEVQGNALNWVYTLQVPVNGRVWDIQLDDWLFLIDENNLINRTKMRKFGLPVGELTLHIRKLSEQESLSMPMHESACKQEV